jgi:peptidoglycan/LPS O-acetylase OafA/YrhL
MEHDSSTRDRRLPSLDGLRAVSIVLVLLGHLNGTRNVGSIPAIRVFGDIAHLGVVVFFVISGFLITSLLLKEHEKTGRISLKLFYARRALRIFPASYNYLAIIAILAVLGLVAVTRSDFAFAASYLINYKVGRSWYVGHLWSLSVEEQFYLLWPCLLVFFGRSRGTLIASAGILLGPVARIASWVLFRGTPYIDLETFPTVADSLAAGCMLALLRPWLETKKPYLRLFHPAASILLAGMLLVINRYMAYTVVSVFGSSAINILIAILIHRSVYCRRDLPGRFLNLQPVAFVGVLSYSLYIWQQPFLNRRSDAWFCAFPQNLILAIAMALASYLLLEKPLMKIRSRLHPSSQAASLTGGAQLTADDASRGM